MFLTLIDDDYAVTGELAKPFNIILSDELRRAVKAREAEALEDAVDRALRENEQRPRKPELALVGADTPDPGLGRGLESEDCGADAGTQTLDPFITRVSPSGAGSSEATGHLLLPAPDGRTSPGTASAPSRLSFHGSRLGEYE